MKHFDFSSVEMNQFNQEGGNKNIYNFPNDLRKSVMHNKIALKVQLSKGCWHSGTSQKTGLPNFTQLQLILYFSVCPSTLKGQTQ